MRGGAVSLYLDRAEALSLAFLVALLVVVLFDFHSRRMILRQLRQMQTQLNRLWG